MRYSGETSCYCPRVPAYLSGSGTKVHDGPQAGQSRKLGVRLATAAYKSGVTVPQDPTRSGSTPCRQRTATSSARSPSSTAQ